MKIGEHMPSFTLKDNKSNWFNSDEFLYKKYFVLFFYPMDFTPTCTQEVCEFRDLNKSFEELDALVLGVNGQSTSSHEKFYNKHQLNFPLLTDEKGKLSKLLGVKKKFGLITPRETFVFNKKGLLIEHIVSKSSNIHTNNSIAAIKKDIKS